MPLLTIAIPTFSRLESLKKAVVPPFRLAGQPDFELLIVDNDSQDGTWAWLNADAAPIGARLLHQKFNVGIEGNIVCTHADKRKL